MNLSLKQQLSIMAAVSVLAVFTLTFMGYLLGKKAGIGSDAYDQIRSTSDFVADIAPPALFMVEAANNSEQLYSLDKKERPAAINVIKKHLAQFDETAEKWSLSSDIPADVAVDVRTKLIPQAKLYQQQLVKFVLEPAERGDDEALLKGYAMAEKLFNEHRAIVYDLVKRAAQLNDKAQAKGIEVVSSYELYLAIVAIISALVVTYSSYYFAQKIVSGLGTDPSELQKIANAVAQGNLDIKLPIIKDKNSVVAATASMIDSLKENLIKAIENQRVRAALDSSSTNVLIADNDKKIIYINPSMQKMLLAVEVDVRSAAPHFFANKVLGSGIDIFNKYQPHEMNMLSSLAQSHVSNIDVGPCIFRLITSPIFDAHGHRLGSVVEWFDRSKEVSAEREVGDLVDKAAQGDFTGRINTEDKEGFFLKAAQGLNDLISTTESGLNDVTRVLGAIAKGDLTEKMEGNYAGTFAELKNYSNNTTESLSEIIGHIRVAAETIFTASSEIAQGNSDLSSRTEQQAANLEETASSMEELTSTVRLNADNAKQANVLAERASTVAVEGGELIQQVVLTMGSINDASQKIADIIGVIDGIAFQTNILALNAAVEAARAGDQGRGFAVVASEVRTLAQRSANAAKDIKGLISDSVKRIESGNTLVGKSGETMKEVVNSIKRVNDIMAEIAAASSEQSAGIEEVSNAVSHMDEMTQQNAALVEQAAAAAESLQSQADQLTQRVGQFKLSEDSDGRRNNSKPSARLAAPTARKLVSPTKKLSPPKNQDDEWESF